MAVGNPFSRRGFLTVGAVGFGLTLGDFFRLKARADLKNYEAIDGQGRVGHPHLPARRHGPPGDRSTPSRSPRSSTAARWARSRRSSTASSSARRLTKTAADRRQDHRHPLDDARRGGPRARHAQHVHRLPAQPGAAVPEHGQRGQPRVRPAEQPAAVRLRPEHAQRRTPAPATSARRSPRSASGSDPADGGFHVQDLNLPGGVDDDAVRHAAGTCSTRSTTTSPSKEKSDDLEAMDTFYQRAYSLISSQKAREAFNINAEPAALRDEYGRNAAGQRHADGPPAGRGRRAVRLADLRRLGHAHRHRRRHAAARCPPFDQAFAALITDLERTRPARQDAGDGLQRVRPHAEDQRTAGRDHWPKVFSVVLAGGGIKKGLDLRHVGRDRQRAGATTRSTVEDLATTVYHQLGIDADKELMAPGDRPIEIVDGGKVAQGTAGLKPPHEPVEDAASFPRGRHTDAGSANALAADRTPTPRPATSSRSPLDDVPAHATDAIDRSCQPSA